MKKFNTKFFTPLLLTFTLSGCMPDSMTKFKKDETKKAAIVAPTVADPTAAANISTLTSFQLLNITQKSTSYLLHKYGAENKKTPCEIPMTSLTDGDSILVDQDSDILCWLEAEEIQLFFSGADLQINSPAGKCEYIQVKPYYYWNAPPKDTNKTVSTVICAQEGSNNCPASGSRSADLKCAGDYTEMGGPNCDEGTIIHNTYTVEADVQADNTVTPNVAFKAGARTPSFNVIKCGGKRQNCLAGPGVDFKVSKKGFPIAVDYLAYNGESINYSVTAPGPLGKGFFSNHYISNFTQMFSTGLTTYDYTPITTDPLFPTLTGMERFSNTSATTTETYLQLSDTTYDPLAGKSAANIAAVNVAMDPLKKSIYKVQPFYEFSCLNYAHEVKGRIRLQIREWNQKFQTPVENYTGEVDYAAPDRLLKQSTDVDDLETSQVGYWNDISNWDTPDDFGNCPANPVVGFCVPAMNSVVSYGFVFPYNGFN